MNYELQGFKITGMNLDDINQEISMVTDVLVGIAGADPRFQTNNSGIKFIVKGFTDYDDLNAKIKQAAAEWVTTNYPNS